MKVSGVKGIVSALLLLTGMGRMSAESINPPHHSADRAHDRAGEEES